MSEFSIEQKAKLYDEVVERAKKWYNAPNVDKIPTFGNKIIEDIFPELKEPEDEQIRKELIDYLKERKSGESYGQYVLRYDHWITWLEKQIDKPLFIFDDILALQCCMETVKKVQEDKELYGQLQSLHNRLHDAYWLENKVNKNLTKVEPMFHEGDWVVNKFGDVWHIDSFDNENYQVSDGKGNYNYFSILHQDEMRLWTIRDAKDGDVLCTYECCEPKIVFILKGTPKKPYVLSYYCYYNIMYPYFESNSKTGCLVPPNEEDLKPATKEQRDLLFQKIKEAGYEWNEEKKELKKIEQTVNTDKVENKQKSSSKDLDWYI